MLNSLRTNLFIIRTESNRHNIILRWHVVRTTNRFAHNTINFLRCIFSRATGICKKANEQEVWRTKWLPLTGREAVLPEKYSKCSQNTRVLSGLHLSLLTRQILSRKVVKSHSRQAGWDAASVTPVCFRQILLIFLAQAGGETEAQCRLHPSASPLALPVEVVLFFTLPVQTFYGKAYLDAMCVGKTEQGIEGGLVQVSPSASLH